MRLLPHSSRAPRALLLVPVVLVAVALAGCLPPQAAPEPPPTTTTTTLAPLVSPDAIQGQSRLTADQLVAYYRKRVSPSNTYRPAGATLEQLAAMYVSEGNRYNVRGDVAFAQSILETGWFHFPDYGIVKYDNNNFAGIGACDTCGNGYQFSSALAGVRAQIQLLCNFADASSRTTTIPDAPVPELGGLNPANAVYNFDHYFKKGWATTWPALGGGNWAMASDYGTVVLSIYDQMLRDSGVSATSSGVDAADASNATIVLPEFQHGDVADDLPIPELR
jgi:hypothetical protein